MWLLSILAYICDTLNKTPGILRAASQLKALAAGGISEFAFPAALSWARFYTI